MPNTRNNPTNNVSEDVVGGIGSPNALKGGSQPASPVELALALEASQKRIAALEADAAQRKSGNDQMNQLVSALLASLQPAQQNTQRVDANPDNLNRTTDFSNQKATVDGRSLVEQQRILMAFRDEAKKPISIPKSTANYVGANLDVTVNGVRVSIPCDGHTYYINESHWLHARERLAKLDLLNSDTEPHVIEMEG